jgi:cysteine-rich repeat protein
VGLPYIMARGVIAFGCGDGELFGAEQCDDGNNDNGDGCDMNCRIEACGNGIIQDGEGCDDGNTVDKDGCSSECVPEECFL